MLKLKKYLNLSSPKNTRLLLWFSGSLFFLGLFAKLTNELFEHKNFLSFDVIILEFIGNHLRNPNFNGTAVDITALGSPAIISLICIIGLISLIVNKDRVGALFLALNVIGGTLWVSLLKNLIARPRPIVIAHLVEVSGQSYPSGHSLVSTVTYFSIALLLCRNAKNLATIITILVVCALIIFMIGFSRMYLGVHYPSDVISGLFFGIAWVLLVTSIFKAVSQSRSFK